MSDTLALIRQFETGGGTNPAGSNVYNYKYASNPQLYSASGYYQITNTNWNAYAPGLGIDTSQYPTAISAPFDQQSQVANYMLQNTPQGVGNWSNYNPQLATALQNGGGNVSGSSNVVTDPWDTSGNAPTGTSGLTMPQWQLDLQNLVAGATGQPPVTAAENGVTGTTGAGSPAQPGTQSAVSSATGSSGWISQITSWLGSIASRAGMLVIGLILLLGAMYIFANNQRS